MGGETVVGIGTGTARDHRDVKAAVVGTTTDLPVAIVTFLTIGAVVEAVGVGLAVAVAEGKGRGKGTATRTNSGTSDAVVIRRRPRSESPPRT